MRTFLKYFVLSLIILIGAASAFFWLSGKTYMFFLLRHTVFEGRLGPSIYEYQIYDNNTVNVGTPKPWHIASTYSESTLNETELAYHQKYHSAAFAVMRDDTLLHETYWGQSSDTSHLNSWSMAKSIISHLIGCALKDGLIKDINDPVGNYLKNREGDQTTIRDLLTMSSGYDYDESYINPFSYSARSLYDKDIRSVHQLYRETKKPGVAFDYQSANTQMLGFILMEVTGKSLSEYASEKLWRPIGAEHRAYWSVDHSGGIERAFCCFNSNARDFGKFGLLYLNQCWLDDSTRLVDSAYYEQAIQPATYLTDADGMNNRYGYQWWTMNYQDENLFYARGIQGQYIIVLPKRRLVIVRQGESRPSIRINGHPEDVYKYIDMGIRIAQNSEH
ncbi:MAG: serine hydrolase [Flavobacteriales bacterium]|nr:serine hydrolase [Bacteroidota bacterium]MCB9241360.1 serine hydrolase [Flavobacteriales bacterium]